MIQFIRGAARPPTARSYRAVARRVRELADQLDAHADPHTPRERAALTLAINILARITRILSRRHHGRPIHDDADR